MTIESNKQFQTVLAKAAGDATTEQLALINMFTLSDLGADDVYVRTAYLAHNAIDRDKDVFDDALLERFATTIRGKGLFVKHPRSYDGDSGPGVGRWFEGKVVDMSHDEARAALKQPDLQWPPGTERAKLLEASFYVPRKEHKQALIDDIDGGVAGDVSIGFIAAERTPILDSTENTVAHRLHAPGEALEGSLVWLGAQPGAHVHKSAKQPSTEEKAMDMTPEQIKSLQDKAAQVDDLQKQVKSLTDENAAFKTAVGETLASDMKALTATIEQAGKVKADLIEKAVAADREAGVVGDTEDDKANAEAMFKGWDVERLEKYVAAFDKRKDAGITGGQPADRSGGEVDTGADTGEKDAFNPLHNPAITRKAA